MGSNHWEILRRVQISGQKRFSGNENSAIKKRKTVAARGSFVPKYRCLVIFKPCILYTLLMYPGEISKRFKTAFKGTVGEGAK